MSGGERGYDGRGAWANQPIVVAGPLSGKEASGLSLSIVGMVRALRRRGASVMLVSTRRQASECDQRIGSTLALLRSEFVDLLRRREVSVVAFQSTYIPLHAAMAYLCRRHGVPYVITPRGGMMAGAQKMKSLKKRAGNIVFFERMVRNAAAIHCLTDSEAADASRWGRPVFVVSNGVDLPEVQLVASPGSHRGVRCVFVGRLSTYHKGLDLLIDACAVAQGELRGHGALIEVYGPGGSKAIKDIRSRIVRQGVCDLVQLKGPVYGVSKALALRSADLFLHTSRFEGHPMAVLEALAHGVPCLVTTGTNVGDVIERSRAGYVAQPDAVSIAEALTTAVSLRDDLAQMGRAARVLAEEDYSWDRVGAELLAQYRARGTQAQGCGPEAS